jgi:hypothetical protein
MTWKHRYQSAHENWFAQEYPNSYKSGFYLIPKMPKVETANGLTNFICNYIKWEGYRATRINVSGRQIKGKWIPSSTRKGTADISATLKGKSVMIEIKVGRDKPRPEQLEEQERERKAGGIYEFVGTTEQFFELYDKILSL